MPQQTQKQRVLQILNQSEWVCSNYFLSQMIPEYRSRLNELRKDGYQIINEKCHGECGTQHRGGQNKWKLLMVSEVTARADEFIRQWPSKVEVKVNQLF